jgi:hypothetical protein
MLRLKRITIYEVFEPMLFCEAAYRISQIYGVVSQRVSDLSRVDINMAQAYAYSNP